MGRHVIHKRGMHEKLVFVDDEILWSGSLNPLSYSNTQEVMERRYSAAVVKDFIAALCVDKLLEEYSQGSPRCRVATAR